MKRVHCMGGKRIEDGTNISKKDLLFCDLLYWRLSGRGLFKYMNEYQIFRESLNIITPFQSFLMPLLHPSFPSFLPRFPVPLTPHFTPLSPLCASLIEHRTPVNPPTLFSHIPTGGSRGCMSAERRWLTKPPLTGAPILNSLLRVCLLPAPLCLLHHHHWSID